MMQTKILCKYPIKYLQDKLLGITTESLVIFACGSGSGKSTISRLITLSARDQKCPVVLYSLEDAEGTFVTDEVRQEYMAATGRTIDLLDFAIADNERPDTFKEFKRRAFERSMETDETGLPLLVVHEAVARNNWTIEKLAKTMKAEIAQGYKLFIIDHLDVLVPSERVDEMARTMNELWAMVAEHNIAIITFSQLSSTRQRNALCPSLDDLRGSRTKGFKATTVVTLARHTYGYYQMVPPDEKASPTYMRIVKQRGKGTGCAIVYFDHGRYIDEYQEVDCNESGTYIDGMTADKLQKLRGK